MTSVCDIFRTSQTESFRQKMDISWIEPNVLAAGSIPVEEEDIKDLHAQKIRAILTLTERPITAFTEISPELLESFDFTYLHVPVPDQFPPNLEQARQILEFLNEMHRQERPIFVHCQAGVGRTGTVLHLYYLAQGLTYKEAAAKVRSKRIQCILLTDLQVEFLNEFAYLTKSAKAK
jgi:atypical dual specificity phosphatase